MMELINKKIDVSPTSEIYTTFKNYAYKIPSAIAEFIDNSISSFQENENFFKGKDKNIVLVFNNDERTILILDNALGIKKAEMSRCLRPGSKPPKQTGMNEFGMGLKTASFWFADNLNIVTKSPYDTFGSKLNMNIQKLAKGEDEIDVFDSDELHTIFKIDHGTIIKLTNVNFNRDISKSTLKSLVNRIASQYRRQINNNSLKISVFYKKNNDIFDLVQEIDTGNVENVTRSLFGGCAIKFKEAEPFVNEKTNDGYAISIDTIVSYYDANNEPKTYPIKGRLFFAGDKDRGRKTAGVDLFRRGRIVLEKYKGLFDDESGFPYQRIRGSFDLDEFPVFSSKDDFAWEGPLEEAFKTTILALKEVKELVKITEKTKIPTSTKNNNSKFSMEKRFPYDGVNYLTNAEKSEFALQNLSKMEIQDSDEAIKIINQDHGEIKVYSRLRNSKDAKFASWFDFDEINGDFIVSFNVDHPFFDDISVANTNKNDYIAWARRLSVFWALAEWETIKMRQPAGEFRKRLDSYIVGNRNDDGV